MNRLRVALLLCICGLPAHADDLDDLFERLANERAPVRIAAADALYIALTNRFLQLGPLVAQRTIDAEDPEVRSSAREVLEAATMHVYFERPYGYCGITHQVVSVKDKRGRAFPAIKILSVFEGTGAEAGGLKSGDLILAVNDCWVDEETRDGAMALLIKSHQPGEQLRFTIIHEQKVVKRTVTLGARLHSESGTSSYFGDRGTFFERWQRAILKAKTINPE